MKIKNNCRLCLKSEGTFSLFSVINNLNVRYMLDFCCSVYVEKDDGLPENVCNSCVNKLKKSFNFKLACLENDYKLKKDVLLNVLDCATILERIKNGTFRISCETQTDEEEVKFNYESTSNIIKDEVVNNGPSIKNDAFRPKCRKSKTQISSNDCIHSDDSVDMDTPLTAFVLDSDNHTEEYGENRLEVIKRKLIVKKEFKSTIHRNCSQNASSDVKLIGPAAKRRKRRLTKYVCEKCGYAANDRTSLRVHYRSHTGERPYVCTTCNKSFAVGENLKVHIRRHTGEKPFVCHSCGKAFSAMSSLRGHMRTHSGERPYSCTTCGHKFSLRSNMLQHLRTHTNDRPHTCELCNSRFISRSDLTAHLRTHSGERPYACIVCGRCFALVSALNKHSLVHTGQRDYECGHCAKCYISKSSLVAHIKSRHLLNQTTDKLTKIPADIAISKPHVCLHCKKGFVKKSSLKLHMKKHTLESEWVEVHRVDPSMRVPEVRLNITSTAEQHITRQLLLRDQNSVKQLQMGDSLVSVVQTLPVVSVATVLPITVVPVSIVTS